MGDHKFTGQVELRRVINVVVRNQTEDSPLGAVLAKSLASIGEEEIKRVRSFLGDNSLNMRYLLQTRLKYLLNALANTHEHVFWNLVDMTEPILWNLTRVFILYIYKSMLICHV